MKKKYWIRTVIFLLLFSLVFAGLLKVFGIKLSGTNASQINNFYSQPEDSLDVVLVGASSVFRSWSSVDAWNDYGISSFAWSTVMQPAVATKYIIKDVLKNQDPDVILVDYRQFRHTTKKIYAEGSIRRVTDNMPWSRNRMEAIDAILDYTEIETSASRMEFYFSFLLYHSRWEEGLQRGDFASEKIDKMQGTVLTATSFQSTPFPKLWSEPTDAVMPLDEELDEILLDLCAFCKEEELPVLFISLPYLLTEEARMTFNYVEQVLEEQGLPYLNMNDCTEEIGIDFMEDYYDEKHTNLKGMKKVTQFLSEYILERYEIPDHRGDPDYAYWNEAYDNYVARVKRNTKE